jgi:membrane associated rhomboid family serine protease
MSIWNEIKATFRYGSTLTRLLYINGALFLVVKVLEMIAVLASQPLLAEVAIRYLAVPASLSDLAAKFWTPITYMFLHQGFIHFIFNLLWLYWFGRIFLQYLDQRKLVAVYLLGGLSGAAFFVAFYNIFPAFSNEVHVTLTLGASASVMAIVVAVAAWVPDHELHLLLLGRIRIKYIALGVFLITTIFDFSENTGGKVAHMGGAIFGLIYSYSLKGGIDAGRFINVIIDTVVTLFKPRSKMRVTYRNAKPPKDDLEYNRMKAEQQAEIDRILEKISRGGYDSLTSEEKKRLFSASQQKNR